MEGAAAPGICGALRLHSDAHHGLPARPRQEAERQRQHAYAVELRAQMQEQEARRRRERQTNRGGEEQPSPPRYQWHAPQLQPRGAAGPGADREPGATWQRPAVGDARRLGDVGLGRHPDAVDAWSPGAGGSGRQDRQWEEAVPAAELGGYVTLPDAGWAGGGDREPRRLGRSQYGLPGLPAEASALQRHQEAAQRKAAYRLELEGQIQENERRRAQASSAGSWQGRAGRRSRGAGWWRARRPRLPTPPGCRPCAP